ncbi:MAG: hypothetical protein ACI4TH_10095 [Candidatus Ornithomonoglobus sp.]
MASDNELLVLIYENIQKTLNQIKDSRVVIQTLANRVGTLEATVERMEESTADIHDRLEAVEETLTGLNDTVYRRTGELAASVTGTGEAVNAMRGTFDRVTNPSILTISNSHMETKEAVRELKTVHNRVMDEFEQYNLRLARTEDAIERLIKNQLLTDAPRTAEENEVKSDAE